MTTFLIFLLVLALGYASIRTRSGAPESRAPLAGGGPVEDRDAQRAVAEVRAISGRRADSDGESVARGRIRRSWVLTPRTR